MVRFFLLSATACIFNCILVCSCSNTQQNSFNTMRAKAGTVIAHLEEPVVEDNLNHSVFSVTLKVDNLLEQGVYDVIAQKGHDTAKDRIAMPKSVMNLKPEIRKGNTAYTYIIGFRTPKDTTFYDYFEVKCASNSIQMKYLKSYSFE